MAATRAHDDPGADEVVDAYRAVLRVDEKNDSARRALADITIRYAEQIERAESLEQGPQVSGMVARVRDRLGDTAPQVKSRADKGDPMAQAAMGLLYRRGILVRQNEKVACEYYRKASRHGPPASAYRYAMCIAETDRARFMPLLQQAAEGGHAAAQHLLGEAYLTGKEQNIQRGAEWVMRAAAQGRPSARSLLAWLYASGTGVPKDEQKAFELYKAAAEANVASAQNNLGEMYETGAAGVKDVSTAAQWYRRAAEAGFPPAEFNLGRLYAEGRGVPKNLLLARSWLRRAQDRGVEEATKLLDWLAKQR